MRWPFKLLFRRPTAEQPAAVKVVPARRDWAKLTPLGPTVDPRPPVIGVVNPWGPITSDTRPLTDHGPRPLPPSDENPTPIQGEATGTIASPTAETGPGGLPAPTTELVSETSPASPLPTRPLQWVLPTRPTPARQTPSLTKATDEFVGEPLESPPPPPEEVDPWLAELMRTYLPAAGVDVPEKYRLSEEDLARQQEPQPSRSDILRQRPTLGQARRLGLGPPLPREQQLPPPGTPPQQPTLAEALESLRSAPEPTMGGPPPMEVVDEEDQRGGGEGWVELEDRESTDETTAGPGPAAPASPGPVYVSRPGWRRGADTELIPPPLARAFHTRTGHDVSQVTVRRDPSVLGRTEQLKATAFTHQEQIYLPREAGELHEPHLEGTLVHELTHVAQQRQYGAAIPDEYSPEGMILEAQAQFAESEVTGRDVPPGFIPLRHRTPTLAVDPADLLGPLLAELRIHGVLAEREPTRPVPSLAVSGVQRKATVDQAEFQQKWIDRMVALLNTNPDTKTAYPDLGDKETRTFFDEQTPGNNVFADLMKAYFGIVDTEIEALKSRNAFQEAWITKTEDIIFTHQQDEGVSIVFPGLLGEGRLANADLTTLAPIIDDQYQFFRDMADLSTGSGSFGGKWPTIPVVTGMEYDEAVDTLKAQGFSKIGNPYFADSFLPAGQAVSIKVANISGDATGKRVRKATEVSVVISLGPEEATLDREQRRLGKGRMFAALFGGLEPISEYDEDNKELLTLDQANLTALPKELKDELEKRKTPKNQQGNVFPAGGAGAAGAAAAAATGVEEEEEGNEEEEEETAKAATPPQRTLPTRSPLPGTSAGAAAASLVARPAPMAPAAAGLAAAGAMGGMLPARSAFASGSNDKPKFKQVPPVYGMSEEEAREVLGNSGFKNIGTVERPSWLDVEDGTVLDVDPPANTRLRTDQPVILVLSQSEAEGGREGLLEQEQALRARGWRSLFGMQPGEKEEDLEVEAKRMALLPKTSAEDNASVAATAVMTGAPNISTKTDSNFGISSTGRPRIDPNDLNMEEMVKLIYPKIETRLRERGLLNRPPYYLR